MRVRQVWVVVLAATMLAACNSAHESPVAAGYGTDLLSGQVALSGLPNGSPAGVEVSVRGTGMKTTLAEDGQFLFAGVPEGAQLDFARAEDGIEASMKVDAATGFLSIELTKTTATASAKKSSRHRGASPTREVVYEFEGTVVSSGAASLVVLTSHKEEQTFAIGADTIIRKGQTAYAAADLLAGWRVHVKATKNADDAYAATVVIVQNTGGDDDDGGAPPASTVKEYEGTVVSSSATQLVVFTSHRDEKTFTVNGDTEIRKGNTAIKPEDLLKGWRVHVKATGDTATQVIVQNTHV